MNVLRKLRAYLTNAVTDPKAHVAETPDEGPRESTGWSPEDGAGYIPTEERQWCPRCRQPSSSLCNDCRDEAEVHY